MIVLQNDELTVAITSRGAELKSIKDCNAVEYIWQADAKFWNKSSPILFPIVGCLKNNTYWYNNAEYKLTRHGFARDFEFEAQQVSCTEAIFTLQANEKTLVNYPFHFKLTVKYTLHNKQLKCTYTVYNLDTKTTMPFSIGAHPAFALPDTEISNYYLSFNSDTFLNRIALTCDGLLKNDVENIILPNQQLTLSHKLFYNDALVFRDLKSSQIILKNKKSNIGLAFNFNDFTHFGIWSAPNAPFICLEPWCGVADTENHNQNILTKEGIILLEPTGIFTKKWDVEII